MARVFSAVSIEDQEVLKELKEVQDHLNLGFNPVDPEKMHITLQFFQDVTANEIDELKKTIDNVDIETFTLELQGVGVFPSNDYIRVIWAGAESQRMHRLKEAVSRHTVEDDNDNSFKPHVTLLRVENVSGDRKRKLQKTLSEFEDHRFGTINVERIDLYESVLNSKGTVYNKIFEKKL